MKAIKVYTCIKHLHAVIVCEHEILTSNFIFCEANLFYSYSFKYYLLINQKYNNNVGQYYCKPNRFGFSWMKRNVNF